MNNEIKQQWISALRSGDYKQTQSTLRNFYSDGFCCLGVLCDLYTKSNPEQVGWVLSQFDNWLFYIGEDFREGVLPDAVIDWAELSDCNPQINQTDLATINDRGVSFDTIADLIEEHL